MSRLAAFVIFALAGLTAVATFMVKHEVQRLEEQLAESHHRIVGAEEKLHVLKAEWSYLNQPERLADLAQRHLGLKAATPRQLVRFEDLPLRALDPATGVSDPSQSYDQGLTPASAGAQR